MLVRKKMIDNKNTSMTMRCCHDGLAGTLAFMRARKARLKRVWKRGGIGDLAAWWRF
jgi:hypothetical protein